MYLRVPSFSFLATAAITRSWDYWYRIFVFLSVDDVCCLIKLCARSFVFLSVDFCIILLCARSFVFLSVDVVCDFILLCAGSFTPAELRIVSHPLLTVSIGKFLSQRIALFEVTIITEPEIFKTLGNQIMFVSFIPSPAAIASELFILLLFFLIIFYFLSFIFLSFFNLFSLQLFLQLSKLQKLEGYFFLLEISLIFSVK